MPQVGYRCSPVGHAQVCMACYIPATISVYVRVDVGDLLIPEASVVIGRELHMRSRLLQLPELE